MRHDRQGTPGGAEEGARDDDVRTVRRTQRLITGIVPRSAATAMEDESRTWMVRCRSCGFERSLWELGGIRWKGSGKSWTWGRCSHCCKRGVHTISRRNPPASAFET